MKRLTGIIIGALLIACGVIYLLDAFKIADVNISLDGWWAFFIIIPCLNSLLTGEDRLGGLIGLAVGVMLLLAAQEVFSYNTVWKAVVPVIVIALGIKTITKSVSGKKEKEVSCKEKAEKERMAAFGSQSFDYEGEEITVAKIGAVFGGAKCNLTNAKIKDGSRVDVLCAFGGADIIVPDNVNIKINTFCLFGGISDKRIVKEAGKDNATLNINGFCIFGGADIK